MRVGGAQRARRGVGVSDTLFPAASDHRGDIETPSTGVQVVRVPLVADMDRDEHCYFIGQRCA